MIYLVAGNQKEAVVWCRENDRHPGYLGDVYILRDLDRPLRLFDQDQVMYVGTSGYPWL